MYKGKSVIAPLVLSIFIFTWLLNGEELLIDKIFQDHNINGTIIISSLDGDEEYVYNKSRSKERFVPASTFKILNTLIALDESAIPDHKTIIDWDGEDKGLSLWNQDMSIETAFKTSCICFYQEIAKRIGNVNYLKHLKKIHYGNEKTGYELISFWLQGDLKISAREQIDFLKKLYSDQLPYKKENLKLVKDLMIDEQNQKFTIRAKTGWATRIRNQIAWYVGYVEANDSVWFFATNIDVKDAKDVNYRREITLQALSKLGIIRN